jgi:CelD/BcsL family acetyltransferase involved in cellulose biosynthesis
MRTRIIERISDLERLVPAWRRLLASASRAEPVLTPLWVLSWWRVFGESEGRALRVVAVENRDELVGLMPLLWRNATHRRAIPVRRVELLATGEDEADEIGSDYVGAIVSPAREDDVAHAMAGAIRRDLGDWDELRMSAMNGDDPFVGKLAGALREAGIAAVLSRKVDAPYIPLPGAWDEYLQLLGPSRRYSVTRSLRELDKWAGPRGWKLRTATTAEDLREGRRALIELHGERWAAAGRAGVFASSRFASFHDEVMPRLLTGEDGASLDLIWLVVDGSPVAATYNIVYRNKIYFYQSGRRIDVPRAVRPGIAMHALAIRRGIESGRAEYDFLAGASRYKRDLALAVRPIVEVRAVASTLRARAVEAARLLAERAIARIRLARAPAVSAPEEHATE